MKTNSFIYGLGVAALSLVLFSCDKKATEPDAPVTPADTTVTPQDTIVEPIVKSGEFSISATEKVLFAPGNLQYQASTKTFRFAANQYDTLGVANASISDTNEGWIDLFGWGTGSNPTLCIGEGDDDNYASQYATFTDWGTNKIGSYAANTWRTLTNEELDYLLYTRTNAAKLHGGATVNGVEGWILLPDTWTAIEGITFKPSTENGLVDEWNTGSYYNGNGDNYQHNVYTAAEWTKLEDAGAIFLPWTGGRFKTNFFSYSNTGTYWTSTAYADVEGFAYSFTFDTANFGIVFYSDVASGYAVRLAKNK